MTCTEWTVSLETPPGLTRSDDVLERIADAIENDSRALGPAVSLNTRTGVLAATFQVVAAAARDAVDIATEIFVPALGEEGHALVGEPGWKYALELAEQREAVPA